MAIAAQITSLRLALTLADYEDRLPVIVADDLYQIATDFQARSR